MTDPSICTTVQCHYLRDSASKCAERACPFSDEREEAPEDPEREDEEEDDTLIWQMMGAGPA